MKFRNRVRSLRRVKAKDLIPNPKNFRVHDDRQEAAIRTALDSVGFAGAVLARQTEDGLMLIDGHLRAGLDPEAKIPVLILDVTDEEADLILATHDSVGEMADTDGGKLNELIDSIEADGELDKLLDLLQSEDLLTFSDTRVMEAPVERVIFREWRMQVDFDVAELFDQKIIQHIDRHGGTCLGLGQRIIELLDSQDITGGG